MERLCSEDQQENAVSACICGYPLPVFCKKHEEEHRTKTSALHFVLPISAAGLITSKIEYMQLKSWVCKLDGNYEILRYHFDEFCQREAEVEAEIKAAFFEIKEKFRTEVEKAINETRLHILDRLTFVPANKLSKLLWENDSNFICSYQLFNIHMSSVKERIVTAIQEGISFLEPGSGDSTIDNAVWIEEKKNIELQLQDMERKLKFAEYQVQELTRESTAKDEYLAVLQRLFLKLLSESLSELDLSFNRSEVMSRDLITRVTEERGIQFRESLVSLETGITAKLVQEKVTISGYHEKVKSEYQDFKEIHDQLRPQMLDGHIQVATEYKDYLVLKSQEKVRYLTDVETYIQQHNEAQAAKRIAFAKSLEVHIQERTAQIESLRYQRKMWIDMKKYNNRMRLGVVAAQLGLIMNIRT